MLLTSSDTKQTMGTRVLQRGSRTNERSIRYGGKICTCLTSMIKTIGDFQSAKEMPITIMLILAYNRSYPKTILGPVPYPLCPVPGYDVGKVQKLESLELLYDYITLFQYPWNEHWCTHSCLQIPPRENWFQYVRDRN